MQDSGFLIKTEKFYCDWNGIDVERHEYNFKVKDHKNRDMGVIIDFWEEEIDGQMLFFIGKQYLRDGKDYWQFMTEDYNDSCSREKAAKKFLNHACKKSQTFKK